MHFLEGWGQWYVDIYRNRIKRAVNRFVNQECYSVAFDYLNSDSSLGVDISREQVLSGTKRRTDEEPLLRVDQDILQEIKKHCDARIS